MTAVHEAAKPPVGHGEVLCDPPFSEWAQLAEANAKAAEEWPESLRALRARARAETVALAEDFSRRIGVGEGAAPSSPLLLATGHQPELYHPGVWIKDFLLQELCNRTGALGIDAVVDTDACGTISLKVPCLSPGVRVCEIPLVRAPEGVSFLQADMPGDAHRRAFREAGMDSLGTLAAPSLARHFSNFCDALDEAATIARDVGTLMTAARRLYERPAGTTYLEFPVSGQARTSAYLTFAGELLVDARRFAGVMNDALAAYRQRTGTRSAAHPFPDLEVSDRRTETPFWVLTNGMRRPAYVDSSGMLLAGDEPLFAMPQSAEEAAAKLEAADAILAPRAVALTLFQRLFVADLFIHGTGGGRYDRATDDIIRGFFGIEPPAFVVASMTLLLPLGAPIVTDADVAEIEQRLHRFEHNPDAMLDEIEFDTVDERMRANALAEEKASLVRAIAAPDADRKTLGIRIRGVNEALGELVRPVTERLRERLELTREERDASAVLTDRTYPYCLWDPREVADKAC